MQADPLGLTGTNVQLDRKTSSSAAANWTHSRPAHGEIPQLFPFRETIVLDPQSKKDGLGGDLENGIFTRVLDPYGHTG